MSRDISYNPFVTTRLEPVVNKLMENVGVKEMDRIRSITWTSLNDNLVPSSDKGVRRAIQLLYNCGQGFFITHAFNFSEDHLKTINFTDDSIQGKSLAEITTNNEAYRRLFKEYRKLYSKQPYFSPDLVKLADIDEVLPANAKDIVKLLLLLVISTKFEG
jgi:hypothetical protein